MWKCVLLVWLHVWTLRQTHVVMKQSVTSCVQSRPDMRCESVYEGVSFSWSYIWLLARKSKMSALETIFLSYSVLLWKWPLHMITCDSICLAYLPRQIITSLCAADLSISGKSTNNLSSSVSLPGLQQRWDAHSRQSMFILSSSSLVHGF